MSASFIPLKTAVTYAVLAGSTVSNTGITTITGDLGIWPGDTISGDNPPTVIGTTNLGNAAAQQAQTDLTTAYNNASSQVPAVDIGGSIGNGQIITPGIYNATSTLSIIGELILDSSDDDEAIWIFQIGSTLITAASSSIVFQTYGSPPEPVGCPGRVYWQVGTTANLGASSSFIGNILASTAITVGTGATINGRALCINTTVTLDTNQIDSSIAYACTGGDPHVLCLDGSRLDVYQEGFYRLFDNCNDNERIIINCDIRRNPDNHFDYYHQIWIKIKNKHEYLLDFGNNGISVNHSLPVLSWEQSYLTSDDHNYIFKCESKYNTVGLTVSLMGPLMCAGLKAGQIISLQSLKDEMVVKPIKIKHGQYDHNSLVAGSGGPHIITSQKRAIRVNNNWFRLLQWETTNSLGIINALFDKDGQIRQMIIYSNQDGTPFHESWKWIGDEHWNLIPFRNNMFIDRQYIHEHKFCPVPHALIFVRIQGNGSVSVSFKNIKYNVRGLLFGDIITINSPDDCRIFEFTDPIAKKFVSKQNDSLYQRLIDPMAT